MMIKQRLYTQRQIICFSAICDIKLTNGKVQTYSYYDTTRYKTLYTLILEKTHQQLNPSLNLLHFRGLTCTGEGHHTVNKIKN